MPIASRSEKYKAIEARALQRYGRCNTIRFVAFPGRKQAFLIQNVFPITREYLIPCLDKQGLQVQIDQRLAREIQSQAQKVLDLTRQGVNILFPEALQIYDELAKQVERENR